MVQQEFVRKKMENGKTQFLKAAQIKA